MYTVCVGFFTHRHLNGLYMSKKSTTKSAEQDSEDNKSLAPQEAQGQDIRGRAVFAVDTSAAGIVIRTAFLSEQGQLLEMPAVFPDLTYALNQIDHLRQLVIERFTQAAQVGVQVIAAQQNAGASTSATGVAAKAPEDTKDV